MAVIIKKMNVRFVKERLGYVKKVMHRVLYVVWICLLGYNTSWAQSQSMKFQNLDLKDGLSHSTVHHVMQDQDGFIWISTRDGLNRYNGQEFEVFQHEPGDPNSLSTNTVWCTMEDRNGLIWIGTNGGGLNVYDRQKKKFHQFLNDPDDKHSLGSNTVISIFEDHEGTIWVGTNGGGLNVVETANFDSEDPSIQFKRYMPDEDDSTSISNEAIMQIAQNRRGYLWVATYGGGVNRMNIERETFESGFEVPGDFVMSLVPKNDQLWMGTKYNGLGMLNLNSDSLYRFTKDPNNPKSINSNFVWPVFIDNEETVWVGTFGGGLNSIRYKKKQGDYNFNITSHRKDSVNTQSLSGDYISHIYEDKEGILWFATDNSGVSMMQRDILFKKPRLKIKDSDLTVDDIKFIDLLPTEEGDQWYGTSLGLLYQPAHTDTAQFVRSENGTKVVNSVEQTSNGKILAGTDIGLYQVIDDRKGNRRLDEMPLSMSSGQISVDRVSDIIQDKNDFIWLATNAGLWKLDQRFTLVDFYDDTQRSEHALSSSSTGKLFLDQDTLWVTTSTGGLNKFYLTTDMIEQYLHDRNESGSIGSKKVSDILRDSAGKIWVATYGGGLNRLDYQNEKPTFIKLQEKDGLPDNTVKDIEEDRFGNIWITTQQGLARMNKQKSEIVPIFIPDDYANLNINKIFAFNDSTYALTLSNGFRLFNPSSFKTKREGPPLQITNIQIQNGNYRGSEEHHNLKELQLNHDQNHVTIEFSILDFFSSDFARYQYKMEGLDQAWINGNNQGRANYSALPPGNYIFQAKATRYDGTPAQNEISLEIFVFPPYWKTWWFSALVMMAVIGICYGMYRYRINALLKVQKTRQRIAGDLHDEISATLSSITYFAQAIRQTNNGQKAERFVGLISESANEAKEKISDIIWSIDPEQDDWMNLLSKCRRFASDLFESKGIDYELDIATDIDYPLDLELRQHLWLIFKEMVVNAARHSKANRVDIFFGVHNDQIELVVQDNGIGLPDNLGENKRYGINNIKNRARKLGAELALNTDKEIGTRWTLRKSMQ